MSRRENNVTSGSLILLHHFGLKAFFGTISQCVWSYDFRKMVKWNKKWMVTLILCVCVCVSFLSFSIYFFWLWSVNQMWEKIFGSVIDLYSSLLIETWTLFNVEKSKKKIWIETVEHTTTLTPSPKIKWSERRTDLAWQCLFGRLLARSVSVHRRGYFFSFINTHRHTHTYIQRSSFQ